MKAIWEMEWLRGATKQLTSVDARPRLPNALLLVCRPCVPHFLACLQARLRLKKEYDLVVGERDVLGTQVKLHTRWQLTACLND